MKCIVLGIELLLLKEGESEKKVLAKTWTKLQMMLSDNVFNAREGNSTCILILREQNKMVPI